MGLFFGTIGYTSTAMAGDIQKDGIEATECNGEKECKKENCCKKKTEKKKTEAKSCESKKGKKACCASKKAEK